MNLFEDQARGRLVAKDSDPDSKLRAFWAAVQDANVDGLATGGARSEPRPIGLSLDLDVLVAEPLDGQTAGCIDIRHRRLFGRAQLAGREGDRARSRSADQEQCPTATLSRNECRAE